MPTDDEAVEPNITELRRDLFATIKDLRSKKIDIATAQAISEVAKQIIDSAKVEVDYLRVAGGGESTFIDGAIGTSNLPDGVTGVRVHRIKG